jgi:predicted secreted Zn-dependent protease
MNRHQDHLAPSDLTDQHREHITNLNRIHRLREQRLALKNEMRALYSTVKMAQHADPGCYREHEAVVKELTQVQAAYQREKKAEFQEDYFDKMPGLEIDKQIDQLLGKSLNVDPIDIVTNV